MSKSKPTEWITRAECAKRLNVTPARISQYVTSGMPTRDDKKVPWPKAERWHADNVVPERSGRFKAMNGRDPALVVSARRKLAAEAALREHELMVKRREFAPVRSMILLQLNRDGHLADMLSQLEGILSAKCAAESDPLVIAKWIRDEVNQIRMAMEQYNGARPKDTGESNVGDNE